MARVYHRDQAGAPILAYSAAAGAAAHFDNLKAVLKACLVSGYGSQPAAGWELISEGTNYIVLRNGSHTGYLALSNTSGTVTVRVAETYLGMSGNIMQGDGLKTGVASGNSVPHRFAIEWFAYADNNSTWVVVADEKTFLLNAVTNNVAGVWTPGVSGAGRLNVLFYAGEDSSGNVIAVGGRNLTTTAIASQINSFSSIGFTPLRDPSTGLLVDTGGLTVETHGLVESARALAPVLTPPAVDMVRPYWHGAGVFGGYLRGLFVPGALSSYISTEVAACLGFAGHNTRTVNVSMDLGDEFSYFVPIYHPTSTLVLMTDNGEFW